MVNKMGRIKKGQTYGHVKVNVWNAKWYYKPSLHKWIPIPRPQAKYCKECGVPTKYCCYGTWLCLRHLPKSVPQPPYS